MSEIKNGGLDQYGAGPFEPQQFGTAGAEGVNDDDCDDDGDDNDDDEVRSYVVGTRSGDEVMLLKLVGCRTRDALVWSSPAGYRCCSTAHVETSTSPPHRPTRLLSPAAHCDVDHRRRTPSHNRRQSLSAIPFQLHTPPVRCSRTW